MDQKSEKMFHCFLEDIEVYGKASLDGYRANKKENKDNKKIVLIKSLMER